MEDGVSIHGSISDCCCWGQQGVRSAGEKRDRSPDPVGGGPLAALKRDGGASPSRGFPFARPSGSPPSRLSELQPFSKTLGLPTGTKMTEFLQNPLQTLLRVSSNPLSDQLM